MTGRWRTGALFILAICLLAPLIAHAYIGSYSRFIADDYCSAAVARSKGVLGGTIHWYTRWTGRFSANFVDSLAGYIGPRLTPYAPPVVLTIWMCVLMGVLLQFAHTQKRSTQLGTCLLLASVILLVTLEITPIVAQSLYWGQGMRSVVPPLILMTLFVGLIQYRQRKRQTAGDAFMWAAVGGGLTFVAGGFSETAVVLQTSALAIASIAVRVAWSSPSRSNVFPILVAGLFGSLLAMTIVIMAPGNQFRQSHFPPPPGLVGLIGIATGSMRVFIRRLVSPARAFGLLGCLAVSVLVGGSPVSANPSAGGFQRKMIRALGWLPPVTILLLLACLLPAAYGMSAEPPGRTLIIPSYLVVCAVAAWGTLFGRVIRDSHIRDARWGRGILQNAMLASVLVLAGLNGVRVTYKVWRLQPEFSTYASAWDKVDEMIWKAKLENITALSVPFLRNWAEMDNLGSDPRHWVNRCMSSYYGVKLVADDPPR